MKALLIAEDQNTIDSIVPTVKQAGAETIVYRWLLKALDNVEEIAPDVVVISTAEYPRHWKTFVQFTKSGIGGVVPRVILYNSRPMNDDEKEKVFSYLVSTFRLPSLVSEGGLSYEEAMHLFRVNESFIREHGTLTQSDLALIRRRQQAMQTALSNAPTDTPIPGDVVEGAYYSGKFRFEGGVIVSTPSWGFGVHFCACPYTPWLYVNDEGKPHINTSGGPFFSCDKVHFEPAGETERMFCEFGHDGPCGNGAVYFPVKVRCWKLKESAGI